MGGMGGLAAGAHATASAFASLRVSSGALDFITSKVSSLTSALNPLNMAIGALGAGLSFNAIMHAGSSMEDMRINMAQTLTFMGEGGTTFEQALSNSRELMQRIVAEAGPLPGNAMDYATAMQISGSIVQGATHDFEKSYQIIKKTAAVGISMGGNASMVATDLNRILNPLHGMLHNMGDFNQKMMTAFRHLPGMAGLTVEEFNKFSLDKRLEMVNASMSQFDEMILAASNSWTAVKGAIESTVTLFTERGTQPIFEAAKKDVQAINSALLDTSTGKFTGLGVTVIAVGRIISNGIVDGLHGAVGLAGKLSGIFMDIANGPVGGMFGAIANKGGALFAAVSGASPTGQGMAMGGIGAAAMGMGPVGIALGVGVGKFMENSDAVSGTLAGLSALLNSLLSAIDPVARVFQFFGNIIGDILVGILPPLGGALAMVVDGLAFFLGSIMTIYESIYTALAPSLQKLFGAVGHLVTAIGGFLGPALELVGLAFLWIWNHVKEYLLPVIKFLVDAMTALWEGIAALLNRLSKYINLGVEALGGTKSDENTPLGAAKNDTDVLGDLGTKLKGLLDTEKAGVNGEKKGWFGGGEAPETPGQRGGGNTVQDFRNSRFEIQQKFAEGFDPDRIAVAFAKDVGRIGEQRLQSGFDPAFSIR